MVDNTWEVIDTWEVMDTWEDNLMGKTLVVGTDGSSDSATAVDKRKGSDLVGFSLRA